MRQPAQSTSAVTSARAASAPSAVAPAPVRYNFAGHQTFPFRYAWLPRAFAALREDPALFAREDALVRLGVGRNMVASIRHWGEALGLFETRAGLTQPLSLGAFLFGEARAHSPPPRGEPPARSAHTQHRR